MNNNEGQHLVEQVKLRLGYGGHYAKSIKVEDGVLHLDVPPHTSPNEIREALGKNIELVAPADNHYAIPVSDIEAAPQLAMGAYSHKACNPRGETSLVRR